MAERRRHERYDVNFQVEVGDSAKAPLSGQVRNVSESGLCIDVDGTPPDTILEIRLEPGTDSEVVLHGRRRWSRPSDGTRVLCGLEFEEVELRNMRKLKKLIFMEKPTRPIPRATRGSDSDNADD